MNYSTWIIAIAIINVFTVFSGFPTGTKKLIIVVTALALLFVGFVLRAIEKKRRERLAQKKAALESNYEPTINELAEDVAEDVHERVEEDIDSIARSEFIEPETHYDDELAQ